LRKTLVIAAREYNAAVRTKAFIVSLILLPVMMGGSVFVQVLTKKYGADIEERKVAIVDRTPGQQLFDVLQASVEKRNAREILDPDTKRQVEPKFTLIKVEPSAPDPDSVNRQRYELSEKMRKKEIFAALEIGNQILSASTQPATSTSPAASGALEPTIVRYTSNSPTYPNVRQWAQRAIAQAATQRKIEELGIKREVAQTLQSQTQVLPKPLAIKDTAGQIGYEKERDQVVNLVMPISLIFLMFVIVLVGSSPMTMNVMEEKQQRIAEVLLGSVRPFELMMGKLLGGAGVALTLMVIYFAGAIWAAKKYGYAQYIDFNALMWFATFSVIAVFLYGSMFVAVGAAVSNAREAQSLITPIMVLVILPMMVLGQLLQSPSGTISTIFSFFPPSAPMAMMARLTIPPGIPLWQPITSLVLLVMTTVLIVWCAGRIFRVGILMQGQGAKLGEMMKWVVSG
jgi:ABC-2 type transport system permease protein